MTDKLTTYIATGALSLVLAAPAAVAQTEDADMGDQATMLTQVVTNRLQTEGFDVDEDTVGDLSLNQIVEIRAQLDEDLTAAERESIEAMFE